MTKSKAIKIIKALIGKYGKDYVLFRFYDKKRYELEDWKRELHIEGADPCRESEGYERARFTLEDLDLIADNEYTKLSDDITIQSAYLKELGLQSIGSVIRQCESNMDYFKLLSIMPLLYVDSAMELKKFEDEHKKEIADIRETRRRTLGMFSSIGRMYTPLMFL